MFSLTHSFPLPAPTALPRARTVCLVVLLASSSVLLAAQGTVAAVGLVHAWGPQPTLWVMRAAMIALAVCLGAWLGGPLVSSPGDDEVMTSLLATAGLLVLGMLALAVSPSLSRLSPHVAGSAYMDQAAALEKRASMLQRAGVDVSHPALALHGVDVRTAQPSEVAAALTALDAASPLVGERALRWIAAARIAGYLNPQQATALMARGFVLKSQVARVRAHALAHPPAPSAPTLQQSAWLRVSGEAPLSASLMGPEVRAP